MRTLTPAVVPVDHAAEGLPRPGSVLEWGVERDEYLADGYRIRLLAPAKWEITHRGSVLSTSKSLKMAFSIVERHRRRALRKRDLIFYGTVVFLSLFIGLAIGEAVTAGNGVWVLALVPVLFLGVSALVRFTATLGGNLDDPYRRRLPWERRLRRR